MKIKSPNLIAIILAAGFTLFAIFLYIAFFTAVGTGEYGKKSNSVSHSYTIPENDTAFGGIFETLRLSDTIPHNQYLRAEAEFKQKRQLVERQNEGSFTVKKQLASLNFYKIEKLNTRQEALDKMMAKSKIDMFLLDSLSIKIGEEKDSIIVKQIQLALDSALAAGNKVIQLNKDDDFDPDKYLYYFGLNGYKLKDEFVTKFFIKNDKNYLAYVKFDTTYKTPDGENMHGHYERREIVPRYSKQDEALLFPINNSTYNFLSYLAIVVMIIFVFVFSFFIIGLPIQILLSIAKGKAFVANNVKNLKRLSWFLGIITSIKISMPLILHWLYAKSIPPEFEFFAYKNLLSDNFETFVALTILIAITAAFKKGYKLQQEQSLTI